MPHDLHLWCEDCQVGYVGDCIQHGPLTRVKDTEVDTRARRSIPRILQLRDQQDFTGVYAKENLAKRLQFGPFQAIKLLDGTDKAKEAADYISRRGGLVLWVSESGGLKYLLDTRQEERTNWMCFVRAAQHKAQQNVVAFQYKGQIYFVTIKEISAECELRVWYSKDYAERMGISLLSEERLLLQFSERERFWCSRCSVPFSSSSALHNHKCEGGNGAGPSTFKHTSSVGTEEQSAQTTLGSSIREIVASSGDSGATTSYFVSVAATASTSRRTIGSSERLTRRARASRIRASAIGRGIVRRQLQGAVLGGTQSIEKEPENKEAESADAAIKGGVSAKRKLDTAWSAVLPSTSKEQKVSGEVPSRVRDESLSEGLGVVSSGVGGSEGASTVNIKHAKAFRTKPKVRTRESEVPGVELLRSEPTASHSSIYRVELSAPSESSSVSEEIRAQVLQSVHSLSSFGAGAALQEEEEESRASDVGGFEPPSSVLEGVGESSGGSIVLVTELSGSETSGSSSKEATTVRESVGEGSSPIEETGDSEGRGGICGTCGEAGAHACSGPRVFSCHICNKNFNSKFKLGRHQLTHGGERQYRCNICDRSFLRKDHLKNHRQIHEPNKQFKCSRPDCGKEYNSYMSYRKHCAFHSAEEGDLQCKFCNKMFDNKNEVIYHLKEHVGTRSVKNPSEKKFQCDQCDRRFFTRKDVKRHLVVHTGTRDFCCTLCPQKFGRKDHLVRHVKKSHGVSDISSVEALVDPLAIPGPSGTSSLGASSIAPVSPSPSSISTSSGDATPSITPFLLETSPLAPVGSPIMQETLSSYQDVEAPSFTEYGDSRDLMLMQSEPIKEEPELTASVTSLDPDISNFLGLYLPPSEGINMSIMESPAATYTTGGTPQLLTVASSSVVSSIAPTPLQQPSSPFSNPQYESLSPVAFTSPHTSPHPAGLPSDPIDQSSSTTSELLLHPPTTSTSSSTSTQTLPGFDQAFP